MSFKFKPKPTVDREATEDELKRIKESEEMLKEEKKLPPTSQMVRDIATTHWKSLKAFMRGKHVIVPQEVAEERWKMYRVWLFYECQVSLCNCRVSNRKMEKI